MNKKPMLGIRPEEEEYRLRIGKDWLGEYIRDLERYCNYLEEKERFYRNLIDKYERDND